MGARQVSDSREHLIKPSRRGHADDQGEDACPDNRVLTARRRAELPPACRECALDGVGADRSVKRSTKLRLVNHSPSPRSWTTPAPAVLFNQGVGGLRSPGSSSVVREVGWWAFLPGFKHRREKAPGRLDLVAPRKQRGIAEHAVEKQSLVSLRLLLAKGEPVQKIHGN